MNLVIVESPSKAKTINKYLGKDYIVLASYGHIRDLPSKDGSVDPDHDFTMTWALSPGASRHVTAILKALKSCDTLYLATDPDREGEAIAWHVLSMLTERKALKGITIHRVVFNAITKDSIDKAFLQPRAVDKDLVAAYLARRALDYLVGFNLSPVLWRKMPGSRSAGRVQSVALRLICDREMDIELFKPQEYWTIGARASIDGIDFPLSLISYGGHKLDKFDFPNQEHASSALDVLRPLSYVVRQVESKPVNRSPYAPFITSTLQQDASHKLYFTAKKTMQLAQQLYEGIDLGGETVGLITYMRTDGLTLDSSFVSATRGYIVKTYGDSYTPSSPRFYKSKIKNAQEAHEAIRPTDITRTPDMVRAYLQDDQWRLYALIWKRTIACQMSNALFEQTTANITDSEKGVHVFRASGSRLLFDGFLRVYGRDADDSSTLLPLLVPSSPLLLTDIEGVQHFTEPPPRYSEATLVKKLEELGIGRPSTYASIISVLQERSYVHLENRRFFPEDRGRIVTAFLTTYFPRYLQYDFTAQLENELDSITEGHLSYLTFLNNFWGDFHTLVQSVLQVRTTEVLDHLNAVLGEHFLGSDRQCPKCHVGTIGLKIGKFGPFIGCSRHPDCTYTRSIGNDDDSGGSLLHDGLMGVDPDTQEPIFLKKGPYGYYVQRGDPPISRSPLPKDISPSACTFAQALFLSHLPKILGSDPETGTPITLAIGRFGPYVKHGALFASFKGDLATATIADALEAIAVQRTKQKELGDYAGKPVVAKKGRFGYYLAYGTLKVPLHKGTTLDSINQTMAFALLETALRDSKATRGTTKSAKVKASTKTKTKAKTTAASKKTIVKKTPKTSKKTPLKDI